MKIQSLSIIFVIIILPISMVLSEYMDKLIEAQEAEIEYDSKLLNSTYDAIKAYQLNTVNNAFGDVTTEKVNDIEAAVNTFFNSLSSNFGYVGYEANLMKEYVPALVFTMYDGYYTYAPFTNIPTEIPDGETDDDKGYDDRFSENEEIKNGLKPYVYYNCRYKYGSNNDFVITYTLANYITIQGFIKGEYIYDYGYIYAVDSDYGIRKISNTTYRYNGIDFYESNTEELKEYLGDVEYSYVKINGKKYYLDDPTTKNYAHGLKDLKGQNINENAQIFYIDSDGEKNYNQVKRYSDDNTPEENEEFLKYYNAIKCNKSAYEYFKNAYEFSKMVFGGGGISGYKDKAGKTVSTSGYGLKDLSTSNAIIYGNNAAALGETDVNSGISHDITNIEQYGSFTIFGEDGYSDGKYVGNADSNFESHRKSVIRYVIETNLTTAIASFASPATASSKFIMPKISETDWSLIENEVCSISFMQGISIGSKTYNGYSVVANTLTKEYVDENDIYFLVKDKTPNENRLYCRANDVGLTNGTYDIITGNTYGSGLWKIDFELKQDASVENRETMIYQPTSYRDGSGKVNAYLGCYTSIMGSTGIIPVGTSTYIDMNAYMRSQNNNLKSTYYTGLARERWSSFNINNINYEIYNGNGNDYFIEDY